MRLRRLALLPVLGGLLCFFSGCAQITNLGAVAPGAPAAGVVSDAYAVNNAGKPGVIAGVFRDAGTGLDRGVVWQRDAAGAWTAKNMGVFSAPAGGSNQTFLSQARALTESTEASREIMVAGFSSDLVAVNPDNPTALTAFVHGALYSAGNSSLINLNTFSNGLNPDGFIGNSHALGITKTPSRGLIYTVGWVEKSGGSRHASLICFTFPDCVNDLGTLPPHAPNADSQANAINNKRESVGYSSAANGEIHATYWFPIPTVGEETPCPPFFARDIGPAGLHSEAMAINNNSVIVGFVVRADGVENAARFNANGPLGMTMLPNLGGRNSRALAINSSGTVVGWAEDSAGTRHAVVWRGGVMTDLNSDCAEGAPALLGGPSWVLTEAHGINDGGAIVGVGLRNGEKRAFLLEPKKWPTP